MISESQNQYATIRDVKEVSAYNPLTGERVLMKRGKDIVYEDGSHAHTLEYEGQIWTLAEVTKCYLEILKKRNLENLAA